MTITPLGVAYFDAISSNNPPPKNLTENASKYVVHNMRLRHKFVVKSGRSEGAKKEQSKYPPTHAPLETRDGKR